VNKQVKVVAVVAAVTLALSGCGSKIQKNSSSGTSGKACGAVNLAVNPWVGYEADAAVVGYLAKTKLGCAVTHGPVVLDLCLVLR
jgi:glycine betaine/proline transport system substrate-binding protein